MLGAQEATLGNAAPGWNLKWRGDVSCEQPEEVTRLEGPKSKPQLDEHFATAHLTRIPFSDELRCGGGSTFRFRLLHGQDDTLNRIGIGNAYTSYNHIVYVNVIQCALRDIA